MALIYVGTPIRVLNFYVDHVQDGVKQYGEWKQCRTDVHIRIKKQLHDIGRRGIPFLTGAKVEGGICCATLGVSPEMSSLPESSAGHFLSGRRWHLKNVSARS